MAIENQDIGITCCNGKTYTKSQIIYRVYIFILLISVIALQISVERITISGMIRGQLVDIHVFLCTLGGGWLLASILAMSPEYINQKNIGDHSTLAFISAILITAGIAVLSGNAKHIYHHHSVTGFICVIAVWIQFILGITILGKENGLWWAKVAHSVLGLIILISVGFCFIFGYGTPGFLVFYSFLSDALTVYTGFAISTAVLTLLILSIPLYKLIRDAVRYFKGST